MAKDHGSSVKDDALYEKLREEGESKERRRRRALRGPDGEEPRERAAELDIEGRAAMDKGELVDALRDH